MAPLPDNDKTADQTKQANDEDKPEATKSLARDAKCQSQDSEGESSNAKELFKDSDNKPQDATDKSLDCEGKSKNFKCKPQGCIQQMKDSKGDSEDAQDLAGQSQAAEDQFLIPKSQGSKDKFLDRKSKFQVAKGKSQDLEGECQDSKCQSQANPQYYDSQISKEKLEVAKEQFEDCDDESQDAKGKLQEDKGQFQDFSGKSHNPKNKLQNVNTHFKDQSKGYKQQPEDSRYQYQASGANWHRSKYYPRDVGASSLDIEGKVKDQPEYSEGDCQGFRDQLHESKDKSQSPLPLDKPKAIFHDSKDQSQYCKCDDEDQLKDVEVKFQYSEMTLHDYKVKSQGAHSQQFFDRSQSAKGQSRKPEGKPQLDSDQCQVFQSTTQGKCQDPKGYKPHDAKHYSQESEVVQDEFQDSEDTPSDPKDKPQMSKFFLRKQDQFKDFKGIPHDAKDKIHDAKCRDSGYKPPVGQYQSQSLLDCKDQSQGCQTTKSQDPKGKLHDAQRLLQDSECALRGPKDQFHEFKASDDAKDQSQDLDAEFQDAEGECQDFQGIAQYFEDKPQYATDKHQNDKNHFQRFGAKSQYFNAPSRNSEDRSYDAKDQFQDIEGKLQNSDTLQNTEGEVKAENDRSQSQKSETTRQGCGKSQDLRVKSQSFEGKCHDAEDQLHSDKEQCHGSGAKSQYSEGKCHNSEARSRHSEAKSQKSQDKSKSHKGKPLDPKVQSQDCVEVAEEEPIIVTHLNDMELKCLLDEAMSYKNPTDRAGKSDLFIDLLRVAEREEINSRADNAVGSAKVRYFNQDYQEALKEGNGKKSGSHGGSLDNLSNKESYERSSASSRSSNYSSKKTKVSARRREGGSLPNDVNVTETCRDFLAEAKRERTMKAKDCTATAKDHLTQDDLPARGYEERLIDGGEPSLLNDPSPVQTHIVTAPTKYISTLQIQPHHPSKVDDPLVIPDLDGSAGEKKPVDSNMLSKVIHHNKSLMNLKNAGMEERKVDENGNALQQKEKKKKKQSDKNVVVVKSENIRGHKSEIIDNVDELLHYIEGTTDNIKSRTVQSKSKQLHKQHTSEDGASKAGKKKQLKSVGKDSNMEVESRHELKKSNSLGEIPGMKLDHTFDGFSNNKNKQEKDKENVALRGNKPTIDRTRERRSWGNVEPHAFQTLYNASSLENLETAADNWEVTRPKKKSKKRRNSLSGASGARQNSSASGVSSTVSNEDRRSRRAPSPDLGVVRVGVSNAKTTRSMPHSEKSNDSSSDVDSVRSLPLDGPISYADIAKNIEKKKPSPEKQERPVPTSKEKSPQPQKSVEADLRSSSSSYVAPQVSVPVEKAPAVPIKDTLSRSNSISKTVVPDVHNIKSFPAITGSVTKTSNAPVSTLANPPIQSVTTSDKAVQSTLSYDDSSVRETAPISLQKAPIVVVQNVPAEFAPSGLIQSARTLPSGGSKRQTPNNSVTKERRSKGMGRDVPQPVGGQGDVHNDLPLMKDPTHYASQRMPPDIMDVSTIEKMQLLNCTGGSNVSNTSNNASYNTSQVSYANSATSTLAAPSVAPALSDTGAHQSTSKGKRKKGSSSSNNNNINNTTSKASGGETRNAVGETVSVVSSVCDTSSEERGVSSNIINGISDDSVFTSPEAHQSDAASVALSSDSLPPVVILSGLAKEVPSGLVFGFDVNEQLLLEDSGGGVQQPQMPNSTVLVSDQNASENNITDISIRRFPNRGDEWAKRFRPPANNRNPPKHNHDKIVNFVAIAWESVLSQQIPYYSDSL